MKIWSSEHVFNHTWDNVVKAALQKYPNPLNPGVVGVDVVERQISNDSIKSHRLLITKWSLAPWICKLIGANNEFCFASEHSHIDVKNKQLLLRSRNLTYNSMINVDEKLVYSIHPEDQNKTLLVQEAQITVKNAPLIDYLEGVVAKTINSNAHKGRQAIEFIINKMNNITDEATNTVKTKLTDTI